MSSDYLDPQTNGTPPYFEIIEDPNTRKPSQRRKTAQSSSLHSSSSRDIYGHVPLSGYSIISVPEESPSHLRMDEEQKVKNHQNVLSTQQNLEDILMNYDHVPTSNHLSRSNQANESVKSHQFSDLDNNAVKCQHNHPYHANLNHNIYHNHVPDQHIRSVCTQVHGPVTSKKVLHQNGFNNIHHSMSDHSFQMNHVRQYCQPVNSNDDILLNYDHVPSQLFYDPHLNYDYPKPNRECKSAEERLSFKKNNENCESNSAEQRLLYKTKSIPVGVNANGHIEHETQSQKKTDTRKINSK